MVESTKNAIISLDKAVELVQDEDDILGLDSQSKFQQMMTLALLITI